MQEDENQPIEASEPTLEDQVKELVADLVPFTLGDSASNGSSNKKGDPGTTWTHHSLDANMPLPDSLSKDGNRVPFILGVDEAGRGPVLGPMVYSCAYAPIEKKPLIKGIGVDDSKKLTESDREKLFLKMMKTEYKDWIGFAVTAISPRDISEGMLRRTKYNLNQQAYDTTIALIRAILNKGVNVTEIYVDTVGKEKPYQVVLEREFPGISITVTTKADSKFPIVSAASIFAKVIRDCVMKNWVFSEAGVPEKPFTRVFGSGYPGDPNTKKWLKQNMDPVFGFPDIIRFSWSTCAKMLEKRTAAVSWPDDGPADKMQNGNIGSYFKKVETAAKPVAAKAIQDDSSDDEGEGVSDEDGGETQDGGNVEDDEEEEEEELPTSKRTRSGSNSKSTATTTKQKITVSTKGKTAAIATTLSTAAGKRKRMTATSSKAAVESDDENVEVTTTKFVVEKVELSRREKTLAVDTSRDALLFRGLSFRHVSVL
ncbi:UNVERIFIED_CONTAM: Ribonuclease H2 subunit A [Siphonaria sp. JEL0065]|nr:Ribonuclease H2 subunit A [Siphonaria sp. JEL0065]